MKYNSNGELLVAGAGGGGGGGGGASAADIGTEVDNKLRATRLATAEQNSAAILAALGQLATLSESQPITAALLPLPIGASTEATLAGISNKIYAKAISAGIDLVQTSATGSDYATLPAGTCTELLLTNVEPLAVDIEFRRSGTGVAILVPFGSSMLIEAIANSNEISLRRADLSNSQLIIRFERRTR